jgi:hypothetical protein
MKIWVTKFMSRTWEWGEEVKKYLLTWISTPRKERRVRYLLMKSLRNGACKIDAVAAKARAQ